MVHTGDITVATNDTLLVQPGVKVYFAGGFKFVVNGLLQAIGTETDSVWFTGDPASFPQDTPTRWRGLRFVNAHEDCQLSYCSISYSGATGAGESSYGGGLYCVNTDLSLFHSKIDHCHCGSETHYGVACGAYFDSSNVTIEFTDITNNHATIGFDGPVSGQVGGVRIDHGDYLLRHSKIQGNISGLSIGGMRIGGGAVVTMDTCLIDGNQTPDGGYGGIVVDSLAVVSMTGTTVSNHNPFYGFDGGMSCTGVRLIMEACTVRTNSASWIAPSPLFGGSAGVRVSNPITARISNSIFENNLGQFGAAILCNNTLIENCTFRNNNATDGAIWSNGGNRISDCLFEDNVASSWGPHLGSYGNGLGGAIVFYSGIDTLKNCLFDGNTSYLVWEEDGGVDTLGTRGGALYCYQEASPYIVNCVFENNSMDLFGGSGTGSVLYNEGGSPAFEFCTLNNNDASAHPGGVIFSDGGSLAMKSCLVSNSTASCAIYFDQGAVGNIEYCDFFGMTGSNFLGTAPAGLGTISTTNANGDACDAFYNIYLDPEYVDAVNGDLHLADTSPCIGAADPVSMVDEDFEHNARPQATGSIADIGAFESAISGVLAPVLDLVIYPDVDNGDVILMWTANPGAASYDIYAGDAPEYDPENFVLIGSTAATSYVDEEVLLASEQRTYVVVAVP
ncbi:MAG: right-handed parallel beta-helix repeat-containing protein [Calditrichaeota bacterium]|nr:right-handed parallel beta-helix repeat-containing protein [Calditrichota bacterium]